MDTNSAGWSKAYNLAKTYDRTLQEFTKLFSVYITTTVNVERLEYGQQLFFELYIFYENNKWYKDLVNINTLLLSEYLP